MRTKDLMLISLGFLLFARVAQADWSAAKRITWNSGGSWRPVIAVDSLGVLHVVWDDATTGNTEIYYKKSTDEGATWTASRRLTWSSGYSLGPALTIDSSDVLHVVWHDDTPGNDEIYYLNSADGGSTWAKSRRLTSTYGNSEYPAIAIDGFGWLHVVWFDDTAGNNEIYYKKSTDGGITWPTSQRLTWTLGDSISRDIAVDTFGNLYAFWEDDQPGNKELYFAKSSDGGDSWAKGRRITWTSGGSYGAAVAAAPFGHLHLVWQDTSPRNSEIYYKKSTDGGAIWISGQRLTWSLGASSEPAIGLDSSGTLHVVWHESGPEHYEIYYKKKTAGGVSWTISERLSWTSMDSYSPSLAIDSSNNLHVVWHDYTPGAPEIYYIKGK